MADNHVTITGNVTRDPELRFTPNGQATASLSVAVNRRWLNKTTQEWDEQVSFFDVVAWGDLAENVSASVVRGQRVTVTGRLNQQTWEDKETGNNRSRVQIVADDVAPSLRWATAQVTKIDRRNDGSTSDHASGSASSPRTESPDNETF